MQQNIGETFLSLRRKILENEYPKLNEMQRKAVLTVSGPLLILAGAGSGKTTVLVSRIAHIMKYGAAYESGEVPSGVTGETVALMEKYLMSKDEEALGAIAPLLPVSPPNPYEILAITFTNKAADEMKERLSSLLGEACASMLWASTFHKACMKILRFDGDKIGYDRNFTVYDTDDSLTSVKEALRLWDRRQEHAAEKRPSGNFPRQGPAFKNGPIHGNGGRRLPPQNRRPGLRAL
jgi:DNA helicase-2/ATP-dependent DNA helicase PcrA